jgi:hypothetical protein
MPSTTEFDRRTPIRPAASLDRDTGTAETDENYDLVSVLYHCLKAADACTQYVVDAEEAGDDELAEFFERARLQQNGLAAEARDLLAQRFAEPARSASEEE